MNTRTTLNAFVFASVLLAAGCANLRALDLFNQEARAVRKAQARIVANLAREHARCTKTRTCPNEHADSAARAK